MAYGQKQELGLTLGGVFTGDRVTAAGTKFSLDSGTNLQASYQYRVVNAGIARIFVGVHFLANGQRNVTSLDRTLTHDFATIYLTPDVMVKFGGGRIQPWLTIGGGVALYEQSRLRLDNAANQADRNITQGAFLAGGGVDVPIFHFIALRGEVREFFSGTPAYNTRVTGGQNNVVIGGGFVLRWH